MPTLKLPMAAAAAAAYSYRTPYELKKWARTVAAGAGTSAGSNNDGKSGVSKKASTRALNSNNHRGERISVVMGRTMLPCGAPPWPDKGSGQKLGFRGHNKKPDIPFFSSTSSHSPPPLSSSSSSGTAVPEMGSEDAAKSPETAPPPPRLQTSKLLTLPTILTLGRVAAVPIFVSSFYVDSWWGPTATTSIFIAAAITDWLDGYIARKMKLGTAFGAFLDPVADKLMVAAALILLCSSPLEVAAFGQVPWLLTVPSMAIIGREITMSAVREWAASQNSKLLEAVAVNNLGKWKTATQMTALTILLATRDNNLAGPGFLVASGVILLYVSSGLALWSLVVYMRKIWKVLLK